MHCGRFRKLVLFLGLGALLLPPLLWGLIVLVAPTGWARSYVVAALEKGSGRKVQLDELSVRLGGGISLANLRIGAPRSIGDPWLKASRIEIDVSPVQLLWGCFEPSRLEVDGATLRVLRRADGSLELADLVGSGSNGSSSTGGDSDEPHRCGAGKLQVRLLRSRVELIDEPTSTVMNFDQVEGEADLEADGALKVNLTGRWNQGPFQFAGHFDPSLGTPIFDGQLRATEVVLDHGMALLRYAVPVLAGTPFHFQGQLAANVYLNGRGKTRAELLRSLSGRGTLSLDPISLAGTPLIAEFSRMTSRGIDDPFGSVRTDFAIKDRRIVSDNISMTLGRVPVNASGWTDFNGGLDYQLRLDQLTDRISEKARKYLTNLDLDVDKLASLRLSGTVDRVTIRSAASGVGEQIDRLMTPEDRQRLKSLSRQLRDKLLR